MTAENGRRGVRGVVVNGPLLRRLMGERGLRSDHLAARARVSEDVIARARAGGRIESKNLSKIVAVLVATPSGDPMLSALIVDDVDVNPKMKAATTLPIAAAEEDGDHGAELRSTG